MTACSESFGWWKLNSRTRGFALLETVIALAVLALILGAVYASQADTVLQSKRRLQRMHALAIAQSVLDETIASTRPNASAGVYADYSWQIQLEPPGAANAAGPRYSTVTVTVQKRGEAVSPVSLSALLPERPRSR